MEYFEKYCSNTMAGSGNQHYFTMEKGEIKTGRVFYKIHSGGEYNYSILFSNIIDSTYANGSISHKNLICDSWKIHGARIGKCKNIPMEKSFEELTMADGDEKSDIVVSDFSEITFSGKEAKEVMPGEFFASDEVLLNFEKGDYLCLEVTFSGKMIPYHEESMIPVFVKGEEGWKYSRRMPFAGMIGCDKKAKKKVAFLGDSITQGIGARPNSYNHWNALLAEKIKNDYAFWNLGLGYGRANDAASGGAWLYKAMQNDVIFVCYGVNDIIQGMEEEVIKKDLKYIVESLKNAGKTVVLQTVPPFDYGDTNRAKWERINLFIKTELKDLADLFFDNVPCLGVEGKEHMTKYGPHPDDEGGKAWAEALYPVVSHLFL